MEWNLRAVYAKQTLRFFFHAVSRRLLFNQTWCHLLGMMVKILQHFFKKIFQNKSTTYPVKITAPVQRKLLWVSVMKHIFGSGSGLFRACARCVVKQRLKYQWILIQKVQVK